MTKLQRAGRFLSGLLMIVFAWFLFDLKDEAYPIIPAVISITLTVYGFRYLIYYFSMARHMVGGKVMLFRGIIALDLGLFTGTLTDVPPFFIMLYLLVIHAFSGTVQVLRALQARRLKGSWRLTFAGGVANLLTVGLCIAFSGSLRMTVYIYAAGMLYSAVLRIASAFRRTAIVFIA